MFRLPPWVGCIWFVVLLAAVVGQPARAGDGGGRRAPAKSVGAPVPTAKQPRTAAVPEAVSPARPSAGVPGLVIALDPLTGDRVRPTPVQILELQRGFEALWDRGGESIEVMLPDGSRGSYVGRRFAKALIAHLGPSGKVAWGCGPMSQSTVGPPIAPEE